MAHITVTLLTSGKDDQTEERVILNADDIVLARRDAGDPERRTAVHLRQPLRIGGQDISALTVIAPFDQFGRLLRAS